jgi:hypothetical protein
MHDRSLASGMTLILKKSINNFLISSTITLVYDSLNLNIIKIEHDIDPIKHPLMFKNKLLHQSLNENGVVLPLVSVSKAVQAEQLKKHMFRI